MSMISSLQATSLETRQLSKGRADKVIELDQLCLLVADTVEKVENSAVAKIR
jgi:hypothetical protein